MTEKLHFSLSLICVGFDAVIRNENNLFYQEFFSHCTH